MKRIFIILTALVAILASSTTSEARIFRYGGRAGINVNSLHFSGDLVNSDNRTGYTFGLTGEVNLPVLPFAVDASLMFTHRNYNISVTDDNGTRYSQSKGANYFEIPVNLKWNISIPAVAAIVKPYIFTGPNFAFLMGKTKISETLKRKNTDIDWDFGFGLELVRHLQLSAYYSLGLSKAYSGDEVGNGRNRCWTVTATYLF